MVGDFHCHGQGPLELYLALKGVHGVAEAKPRMTHTDAVIDRLVEQGLVAPGRVYRALAQAVMAQHNDRYEAQDFFDDRDLLVTRLQDDLKELRRFYQRQWGRDMPMPRFPVLESADELGRLITDDLLLSARRPPSKGRGRRSKPWLPALHTRLRQHGITAKEDRVALLDATKLTEHYQTGQS